MIPNKLDVNNVSGTNFVYIILFLKKLKHYYHNPIPPPLLVPE